MNNYCTEKYNISSKDFPSAQLRDKQLLIIFLQLVQSRQKKLRNQRKNYCTSISSHSYFGSTKNGQELEFSEYEEDTWSNSFLEWRFISDQIHESLRSFDTKDIDNYAGTEDIYEDIDERPKQPKRRNRLNVSLHSINTRLCYCWLIVVVVIIIIIIIVTTWRSKV